MEIAKIGLFVNGIKVKEYDYDEYDKALEEIVYSYNETGKPHELKFI